MSGLWPYFYSSCLSIIITILTRTAPSAPPAFVKLSVVSSTKIKVTWRRPDCRHQNGVITGYSVRYKKEGIGEENIGAGGILTKLLKVTKKSVYTVEVAAKTSAGTGVYSEIQTIETPDSEHFAFCLTLYTML